LNVRASSAWAVVIRETELDLSLLEVSCVFQQKKQTLPTLKLACRAVFYFLAKQMEFSFTELDYVRFNFQQDSFLQLFFSPPPLIIPYWNVNGYYVGG
jgi:hypothetical protein